MNGKEKILLVDDELRVVQALQRALRCEFNIEIAGGAVAGFVPPGSLVSAIARPYRRPSMS